MRLAPTSKFKHVRLGECGEIVTGSTPSKKVSEFWNGDIPFVTPAQLGHKKPVTSSTEFVTTAGASKGRLLPQESVLVCCIGSLGKTGVAGVPLISNQQINAIVFDSKMADSRYGYFAASNLTPLLEHYAPSTTVKIVKKSAFANLEIPLPPLPEQKRIAAILDAADDLRAKRRESLEQLDQLLQSTFLEMFGDPVTNPKGWEQIPMGNLCEFSQGIQVPVDSQYLEYSDGLVRFLRIIDYTQQDAPRFVKYPGKRYEVCCDDIAIVRYGASAGHIGFGKAGVIANNLFKLNFDKKEILPIYLFNLLSSEHFKAFIRKNAFGAAMPALSFKMMNDFEVLIPPLNLQQRYATIAESIEQQKARYRTQLDELDTLFASLQSRAFI